MANSSSQMREVAAVDSDRRAARYAGVLFIAATALSIAGSTLSQPALDAPDHLAGFASYPGQVAGAALLSFLAAAASAGIAIAMYPVLMRSNAALAMGSVVFRSIEAVMYVVAAADLLAILAMSQQLATAGEGERASFQVIGDSLLAVREEAVLMGVIAFSVGAFLYYYVFYRSRLMPRWLSGWGLAAIVLAAVACVSALFSQRPLTSYAIVMIPIAVQEMVLAVWLIARGFDAEVLRAAPGRRSELAAAQRV